MVRPLPPVALALLASLAAGCQRPAAPAAAAEAPVLPVSKPVQREVTDYVDFTGRTDAVQAVDIRARVTGYIERIPFKEGSEVHKGDLLFEIDPRPYEAQLNQAGGQVALYQAQLKLAESTLARDLEAGRTPAAVSPLQIDQDRAAVEEARARVKAAGASTEIYKLNLEYSKVKSPIDGQISRYYLTVGN